MLAADAGVLYPPKAADVGSTCEGGNKSIGASGLRTGVRRGSSPKFRKMSLNSKGGGECRQEETQCTWYQYQVYFCPSVIPIIFSSLVASPGSCSWLCMLAEVRVPDVKSMTPAAEL